MVSPYLYAGYECNNNCRFCSEADLLLTKKSFEQIKKELKKIRKNYDFVNIMGKEPTIRKDIFEIVRYAKKLKFKQVGVTTNGRMLSYETFAKKLVESGIDQVVVSIYGYNAKLHDSQTGVKGSFKETIEGIDNIKKFKNKNLSLLVNVVINRLNYKKLPKIVNFVISLGIKEINLLNISPLSERSKTKELVPKMSNITNYLLKVLNKYKDKDVKILFVEFPPCLIAKNYRKYFFPCIEHNLNKIKFEICKKCEYNLLCTGILKEYIELYGDKEFRK